MGGTSVARAAGILAPEMSVLCARWHAVRPCPRLWWQLVSAFLRGGLMLFTALAGMGRAKPVSSSAGPGADSGAVEVVAHRPDVAGRDGSHSVQVVADAARAGAGDTLPAWCRPSARSGSGAWCRCRSRSGQLVPARPPGRRDDLGVDWLRTSPPRSGGRPTPADWNLPTGVRTL